MDDSCAVCAEPLEWVAYGSCGHKEVCSTCVARLLFICNDRRCCICKSESTLIFVTKALGDYTKMINDFSVFPSEAKEGRSGSYWYHEDTQIYFDDLDHYKMIKAMCRLSCSVCDKMEDHPHPNNPPKKRARFRNIEQLKGHLFHQHKLFMCSLCLEGRKVFICEQKLYSRAQLKQHVNTGDSEVDGTESERGGFKGHPLCEFCRSPFYGDNELYTHMSTEHYTCHICQRQHPGQYEYYKNYDDLEIHFRQEHFLCEDEDCLAKKFVVFQSEAEMKRHNTLEHGGRMSRSKRNAALQLPTSFRYRRSNEQDNRRGRGRTFQRDLSDAELSRAIEASFETSNVNARYPDSSSSSVPLVSDNDNTDDVDLLVQPFEALGADSEPPSRYLQAVSHRSRHGPLEESSFPPLSTGPGSMQKPPNDPEGLPRNTMAENLRRQNKKKVNVLNTAQAWPAASRLHNASSSTAVQSRPANSSHGLSLSSGQSNSAINSRSTVSGRPSSVQAQTSSVREPPSTGSIASSGWNSTTRISHSSSAPNLVDAGSMSDFPPVSALQTRNPPLSGQSMKNVEDVHTANKFMVEKIRAGLDYDQDKYAAFKDISAEYRQGAIDAGTYLVYVEQFGLSHLVPELARLCPDPSKEKDLIAVYNANQNISGPRGNNWINGKGKLVVAGNNSKGKSVVDNNTSKDKLTNSILSTVRELQSNYRPVAVEEEVETLSKDGYRATSKGKSKSVVDGSHSDQTSSSGQFLLKPKSESAGDVRSVSGGVDGDGKSKQPRKKTSKFHRVRLGNDSMAALLDLNNSNTGSDSRTEAASDGNNDQSSEGLPVRGVWRNGGGQRLLSKTAKRP